MNYSQNSEQEIITDYFKDIKGSFLDIGAADGKVMSNTYQILLNGWSGVMVEPSAHLLPALLKNTEGLNAEIVNALVGITQGWQTFYESNGDFLSTTNLDHVARWKDVPFRPTQVFGIHFMTLKEKYEDTFDFINIDTECTSAELFFNMFEHFTNCKMWCIEHDGRQDDILTLAQTRGFKELLRNNENIIVAK